MPKQESKLSEKETGYREYFLGEKSKVRLPRLPKAFEPKVAPVKGESKGILHYHHYSVVQNAERRLPFFTAANIDGRAFVDLNRRDIFPGGRDRWRKDGRLESEHQWGQELYSAKDSNFDRGHMTRREDVQWGTDTEDARQAAQSTFFFPNAVPQHADLNQAVWSNLEDYILHEEVVGRGLRINLFTGPVFRVDDPVFIRPVRGVHVQLPVLFWKVVFYQRPDGRLNRVAFLMNQKNLLEQEGIVEPAPIPRGVEVEPVPEALRFLTFEDADTYQVKVTLIQQLTGLSFARAWDPLKRRDGIKLTIERVEVPARSRSLEGTEEVTIVRGLCL